MADSAYTILQSGILRILTQDREVIKTSRDWADLIKSFVDSETGGGTSAAATSVLGNPLPFPAPVVDIQAVTDGTFLGRSGGTLSWQNVPGASIYADGINIGTIKLSTIPAAALITGTTAWVNSVGDYFKLVQSGLATTPTTIIAASGRPGFVWERMGVSNADWAASTAWWVDPQNVSTFASDENSGQSSSLPLATFGELGRRLTNAYLVGNISVTVTLMSNGSSSDPLLLHGITTGDGEPFLTIIGTPTVIASGRTISTPRNPAITDNDHFEITDIGAVFTPWIQTYLLHRTNGISVYFWPYKDLGSGHLQISPPLSPTSLSNIKTLTDGDTYEVLQLPTFAGVYFSTASSLLIVKISEVNLIGSSGLGGSFVSATNVGEVAIDRSLIGGAFVSIGSTEDSSSVILENVCIPLGSGGATWQGPVTTFGGLFAGNGTSAFIEYVEGYTLGGNTSNVMTLGGVQFQVVHDARQEKLAFMAYDFGSVWPAVAVSHLASAWISTIGGERNAGLLVSTDSAGKVGSQDFSSWNSAATSSSTPYSYGATFYTQAQLGIDTNHLATAGGGIYQMETGAWGGDLSGNGVNPSVVAIHTGSTQLPIGSISINQFLFNNGSNQIVGVSSIPIGSLSPIPANTLVGNPTGSSAAPTTISLGTTSGVLEYVNGSPDTLAVFAATVARVPFGSGTNGGLTDNSFLTFTASTVGTLTVGAGSSTAVATAGGSGGAGAATLSLTNGATAILTAQSNVTASLVLDAGASSPLISATGASGTNFSQIRLTGTNSATGTQVLMQNDLGHGITIDVFGSTSSIPDTSELVSQTANGMLFINLAAGVAFSSSAFSTSNTISFMQLQSMAGVPTGVPTVITGQIPVVVDSSDDRLYAYNSSWKIYGQYDGSLSGAPGLLKTNTSGIHSIAISGTDYQPPGNYITALTGDVTATGPGSVAATIGNNKVTYAKIQQVSAVSLLGNPTGSTANVSEITLGSGLAFSGTTLVATGGSGSVTVVTGIAPIFITSTPTTTPNVTIQGAIVSGSTSTTAQNLGLLTTGLLKGTVSGGVNTISTAIAGTDYQAPITWPAATEVLISAGTSTPPVGDVNFIYDTTNHILSIGNGTATAGQRVYILGTETLASATSLKWDPLRIDPGTLTLTGTTNVTTAAGLNAVTINSPTITDGSAVTVTNAATLAILGAPAASGSVTITNSYALWSQAGINRFDGTVYLADGALNSPSLAFTAATTVGMYRSTTSSGGVAFGQGTNGLFEAYSSAGTANIRLLAFPSNIWFNTATSTSAGAFILCDIGDNLFIGSADGQVNVGKSGALATNATGAFLGLTSSAGVPTGTPGGSFTGKILLTGNTTDSRIYAWSVASAAWQPWIQYTGGFATGLLKSTTGTGIWSIASAGTDYVQTVSVTAPITNSGTAANPNIAIQGAIVSGSTSTTAQNIGLLSTGLLKGTVSGGINTISTAVASTDYQAPMNAGPGINLTALGTQINLGSVGAPTAPTVAEFGNVPPSAASAASMQAVYQWDAATITLTGTTHVTGNGLGLMNLQAPTITDTSSCTVDTASTLAISGAPIQAGHISISNKYAFWVQSGDVRIDALAGPGWVHADSNGVLATQVPPIGISYRWSMYTFGFSAKGPLINRTSATFPADTGPLNMGATGTETGSSATSEVYVANTINTGDFIPLYEINSTYGGGGTFSVYLWYVSVTGSGNTTLEWSLWYTTDPTNISDAIQLTSKSWTGTGTGLIGALGTVTFSTSVPSGSFLFLSLQRTDNNSGVTAVAPVQFTATLDLSK